MTPKWQVIHAYRRLAEAGKVAWLQCPDDNSPYITRLGPDEDPMLWCPICHSTVLPGIHVFDQMDAAVKDARNAYNYYT